MTTLAEELPFVLQCGDGWEPMIRDLHESLLKLDPNYIVFQCKEKFGGLRYYVATDLPFGTPEAAKFEAKIILAEKASFRICEVCGEDGLLSVRNYWMKTLCAAHRTDGYVVAEGEEPDEMDC